MSNIIKNNKDVLPYVHASCHYGVNALGIENLNKCISFLVVSDIHGATKRLSSAIKYLNYNDCLDFGIHLGDIQPSKFNDNNGKWFTNLINKSKKPFLSVMGNHDGGNSKNAEICANRQQVFDKFIAPIKKKIGIENIDKTYYLKKFDKYKISVIVLDNFIQPYIVENGECKYNTGTICYPQEEIDWFINTLNGIPKDYHLIVAMHAFDEACTPLNCVWSKPNTSIISSEPIVYQKQELISSIIDAWVNGKPISREVLPAKEFAEFPKLNVNADFTKRGKGVFVSYIIGHYHVDMILKSDKYPYQNIILFPTAADDLWQNVAHELPRTLNTKQEDCLTVMSIDNKLRRINLVRIGSNVTVDMTERKFFTLNY